MVDRKQDQDPSHVHITQEAYASVVAALYASIGEVRAAGSLNRLDGGIDDLLSLVERRLESAADMLVDADHHHVPYELPCECRPEVRQ